MTSVKTNWLALINMNIMKKGLISAPGSSTEPEAAGFNFNKLQAVACMAASAAVTIACITWAVKAVF